MLVAGAACLGAFIATAIFFSPLDPGGLLAALKFAASLVYRESRSLLFPGEDGSRARGNGKLVLITGCDSGIGNLAAKDLHGRGYAVVAACLSADAAKSLEKECPGLTGVRCNVTSDEDVSALAAKVAALGGGKLHAVVSNAGVNRPGEVMVVSMAMVEQIINVNLLGSIRVCKAALPMLVNTPGSRAVFTSSICGVNGLAGVGPYCASKHGVEGFVEALRHEVEGFGVQVSTVNPGAMRTPLVAAFREDVVKVFQGCPPEVQALYGRDYGERVAEGFDAVEAGADHPQVAVDDICRAVGAERPRHRYHSGFASRTIFRFSGLCPPYAAHMNRAGRVPPKGVTAGAAEALAAAG